MKAGSLAMLLVSFLLMLFLASPATIAADAPKEPITIKIEGAKMPPVAFSHEAHQKRGIDCAKCHHKDAKDPQSLYDLSRERAERRGNPGQGSLPQYVHKLP